MHCINLIKKKFIVALTALFAVMNLTAQTTTPVTPAATSSYNLLAILLVVMTVVLAFVIWGLGQILVALTTQLMEKNKAEKKSIAAVLVMVLLFASQAVTAQTTTATEAAKVLPNYGGLSSTTFYMFVTVIVVEVIAVLFLVFSIRRIYTELLPKKELAVKQKPALAAWWSGLDKKVFTKAVAIEKEEDILLDHDYDGIKELDNALPPWWKYGFYITIAIALVYILNFHVMGNGKNPTEEYAAEMESARIQKEIFEAGNKDKIDEKNVPMADAAGLARAKTIYTEKCVACHGNLGQGGVGPNLTDDYWLHKGSLNAIYNTLKVGYPDKGMQSWAAQFTPKQLSQVASYIKTLKGTKPAMPKVAQGELYTEEAVAATDSLAAPVKKDSATAATPSK
jgi:cytochrome c oxidase cbb3-type subunit III